MFSTTFAGSTPHFSSSVPLISGNNNRAVSHLQPSGAIAEEAQLLGNLFLGNRFLFLRSPGCFGVSAHSTCQLIKVLNLVNRSSLCSWGDMAAPCSSPAGSSFNQTRSKRVIGPIVHRRLLKSAFHRSTSASFHNHTDAHLHTHTRLGTPLHKSCLCHVTFLLD